MALDDTDRRRILLAVIVSLIALPAFWWVNRDAAPDASDAPVGVEAGGSINGEPATPPSSTLDESAYDHSNLPNEPTINDEPPIFLDGPASNIGGRSQIAVPNADAAETIITRATFGEFSGADSCLVRNISTGQVVTVINLDNYRTITCRVALAPASQEADIVLQKSQFTTLADLTDAPIPVQIRL